MDNEIKKAIENHETFIFPQDIEFWEGGEINANDLGLTDVTDKQSDVFAHCNGDGYNLGVLGDSDGNLWAVIHDCGDNKCVAVDSWDEARDILGCPRGYFRSLDPTGIFDIVDGETGNWITQGIQGATAMSMSWTPGDEAWPCGEEEFSGSPIETAS